MSLPQDQIPNEQPSSTFWRIAISVLITAVSLGLILLLFFKIDWLRASAGTVAINRVVICYFLLSALFGSAVGASEIISRYRDEPFTALTSSPGRWYMFLNATISSAAFFLLIHYQGQIFSSLKQDLFLTSVVAGFGSMVIMRSKLFNFKTENGEDYAIGPEAVLAIFLTSVDRQIDRDRASTRQKVVFDETKDIIDPMNAPGFLRAFLISYQNLTSAEKAKINDDIATCYASPELATPLLKFMAVAFGFLNIMGEKNFRALISNLKAYQALAAAQNGANEVSGTQNPTGNSA
jgi:hypothetical protein